MNYNLLSTQETEKSLLQTCGLLYEHGEKAGCHLAHQIKSQSASQQIKQIRTSSGELTVMPSVINETFKNFTLNYTLYNPQPINRMSFLDNLKFPSISSTQKSEMDRPLEIHEIIDSIKLMQSGRASGPGGYPIEFFKKFADKLTPLLPVQ